MSGDPGPLDADAPVLAYPPQGAGRDPAALGRRSLLLWAPLGVAAVAGASFLAMLRGLSTGSFDPRGVPDPLVGHRVPNFLLPAQPPATTGFSSADLLAAGRPVLVNFFASWCMPCVAEAPLLMKLSKEGVPIWGVAYKDTEQAAADMLAHNGDPYKRLARDAPGRVAIDWGLYGVPETYFVDRDGIIRWRWAGPLTDEVLGEHLRPLLRKYG